MLTTLAALAVLLATPRVSEEPRRFERLCGEVASDYDSAQGGFVSKDGAPIEGAVELAFALGREQGDPLWIARGHRTVDWMRGLYDSTGGGFVLTTKDADPAHPSFDKPTWANARRLEILIDAWTRGNDERQRAMAARIVDYMDRVLLDPRGGFVAGQVGDRQLVPEANGYAIRAWLRWAAATADPRIRDFALKSLDRVWESGFSDGLGLIRRDDFGQVAGAPRLVDQTEMGRAFILAAHFAGRERDLQRARILGRLLLAHFEDPEKGGFAEHARPTGGSADEPKVRRGGREFDQNALAVRFLAELASVTGDNQYRDAARRAAPAFDKNLGKPGEHAADWALALRALRASDLPARPTWAEATAEKEKPVRPRVFRVGKWRR